MMVFLIDDVVDDDIEVLFAKGENPIPDLPLETVGQCGIQDIDLVRGVPLYYTHII
jgi:hypothetical protein